VNVARSNVTHHKISLPCDLCFLCGKIFNKYLAFALNKYSGSDHHFCWHDLVAPLHIVISSTLTLLHESALRRRRTTF